MSHFIAASAVHFAKTSTLQIARNVLKTEVAGLVSLAASQDERFGSLGVIHKNGVQYCTLSKGDLRRSMEPNLQTRLAGEVMTPSPRTIGPDALAVEALLTMNLHEPPGCITAHRRYGWQTSRHPARSCPAAHEDCMNARSAPFLLATTIGSSGVQT